jgi:hypothetical protein
MSHGWLRASVAVVAMAAAADGMASSAREVLQSSNQRQATRNQPADARCESRRNETIQLVNVSAVDVLHKLVVERAAFQNCAIPGHTCERLAMLQDIVIAAEPVTNTLSISISQCYYEEVTRWVSEIDVAPALIQFDLFFAEVILDDQDNVLSAQKLGENSDQPGHGAVAIELPHGKRDEWIQKLEHQRRLVGFSAPQLVTTANEVAHMAIGNAELQIESKVNQDSSVTVRVMQHVSGKNHAGTANSQTIETTFTTKDNETYVLRCAAARP